MGGAEGCRAFVDYRDLISLAEPEYLKAPVITWWGKRLWNLLEHV